MKKKNDYENRPGYLHTKQGKQLILALVLVVVFFRVLVLIFG